MTGAPSSVTAPSTRARPPIHDAFGDPVLKDQDPRRVLRAPSMRSVPIPALD
jgi:hypothetical protein